MNILALIIGLFTTAVGLAGIVAPTDLATIAQNATTPAGAYVLAAIMLVLGTVLIRASRTARIPVVLQIVGLVVVVGALAVPFVGDRIVTWWVEQGPQFIRLTSLAKIAVGVAVVFAANP